MKKRMGCLLLVLFLCFALTACGGGEKPTPTDEPATSTQADTASSQAVTTSAIMQTDAPATTTTTTTTQEASTTAPTTTGTTKTTTICPTRAVPITVASPFTDIGITEIALYDPQLFQMEEATLVKSLTDAAEVDAVAERLSAATWEYYPTQDKWVKYNPIFAEWALVLTDTDGKQWVLHLLSADTGWASLGTFAPDLTYAAIIEQAKTHDKEGVDDFHRYKIDNETLAYLLALF